MRPSPGDRGSWSHGPIARVQPRAGAARTEAAVEVPAPAPPYSPGRRQVQPPAGMRPMGPGGRPLLPPARAGFGLPSLRRNVCPHFYMTGSRGAIPIQAPHLLKGLLRQPNNVSRCQLRGGVHLDEGYVNDVCLTPRFNQCVFYEDELTKG
ncbi:MAG: hypothetical protein A2V85_13885 [Chloroflexi bacterium RBG_16_72_14]|nr:MAG: hypothetical protein A2V85_13885 [Chloroflexi bacterium RBG_16_72_14]